MVFMSDGNWNGLSLIESLPQRPRWLGCITVVVGPQIFIQRAEISTLRVFSMDIHGCDFLEILLVNFSFSN